MPGIEDLFIHEDNQADVNTCSNKPKDVESITKQLQDPSVSPLDARTLFDGVLKRFSAIHTKRHLLGPNIDVVDIPRFGTALVKIQDSFGHRPTPAEERLCSTF